MDRSTRCRAIGLSVLFAISYCAVGFFGALGTIYKTIQTGIAQPLFLGWYHILLLVTVPLYFLPLSLWISRLAKKAGMKILRIIAIFMIVCFALFIAVNIVILAIYFMNPGFFA